MKPSIAQCAELVTLAMLQLPAYSTIQQLPADLGYVQR